MNHLLSWPAMFCICTIFVVPLRLCPNPDQYQESCPPCAVLNPTKWNHRRLFVLNLFWVPGTHWIRLATMALKWARMSLRISASLSFSASSSIRVRSTYSRNKAPKARVSRSRAPLVLYDHRQNQINRHCKTKWYVTSNISTALTTFAKVQIKYRHLFFCFVVKSLRLYFDEPVCSCECDTMQYGAVI